MKKKLAEWFEKNRHTVAWEFLKIFIPVGFGFATGVTFSFVAGILLVFVASTGEVVIDIPRLCWWGFAGFVIGLAMGIWFVVRGSMAIAREDKTYSR